MKMIFKNAEILNENFEFVKGNLSVADGKILGIDCENNDAEIIDCTGLKILPGFIDIHIHGTNGGDTCDAKEESLQIMSENLPRHGVTSFCPATMTLSGEELEEIFRTVSLVKGKEKGAYIHGINMEGPYISLAKKGAQKAEHVRKPDIIEFKKLNDICKVSLVDIAPEEDENNAFSKEASEICTVSVAHTSADSAQARKGFENGITHATHLFNAMTGISARVPGVAGAVFDSDNVRAEIICDGFHVAPETLRMAFKLLGEDRTIVISDSMKAADCEDGEYMLGGQTVFVRDGKALLADGTIAASTSNIFDEFRNLLSFGIPFKHAVKSCTINPAKAIGQDEVTGSIEKGKNADLIIIDENTEIKSVYIKGKKII